MAEYPLLRVLKYTDLDAYEAEYEKRLRDAGTYRTKLRMHPFVRDHLDTEQEHPIFYVPIPSLGLLHDSIYNNSKTISVLQKSLPGSAQEKVFTHCLIEEIQASNTIEGVNSTRREIADAIQVVFGKKNTVTRFLGLVRLYSLFQKEQYNSITGIEDIRTIYEQLLSGEIEADNMPDGKLFRREGVSISETNQIVHVGVSGEKQIENRMKELVQFMNEHDVPSLEKCFIAHYFFEYIHPFYDGNGRLGRFIACSYLSRKLDYLSAISFSTAIVKQKSSYEKAFQEVSNPANRGEITHFLSAMLSFMNEGQESVIEQLTRGKERYERACVYLKRQTFDTLEYNIVDLLVQQRLFGSPAEVFSDMDIRTQLENVVSRRKLDTAFALLRGKAVLRQIKRRPSVHTLTPSFEKNMMAELR